MATDSPLQYAPVDVPSPTKGAVCSPASQIPLSGIPLLMALTSSSRTTVLPTSLTWKFVYDPFPARSSFCQFVASTAEGVHFGFAFS